MEVRVEKKKRREADDPVIYAQASEWIHQGGVFSNGSHIHTSPNPTPRACIFTNIWLYVQMNISWGPAQLLWEFREEDKAAELSPLWPFNNINN